jgi:putative intracellular protease/amidase
VRLNLLYLETKMKTAKALLATIVLAAASATQAANVLVVLSDANHLDLKDGKTYPTGFYLNELLQPVKMLLDAGHQVTFATPMGNAPTLDQNSVDPMYFNGDAGALKANLAFLEKLALTSARNSPVISLSRVEQIGYERFDAVYIPGGHAPMQDLIASAPLGRLLSSFHAKNKTTALVCHGPAALLSAREGTAKWIYEGYRMTVISNEEEGLAKAALKGGEMKLLPQTGLEQAGGKYSSNTKPWSAYVVTDRELITGQNPASAVQVGQALLARLNQ